MTSEKMTDEMNELYEIMNIYKLGRVRSIELDELGLANHNYFVITDIDEYVVRFLVEQREESLENDLAIHDQLEELSILTPVYIRLKGREYVHQGNSYPVVIMKKITGLHPTETDNELCFEMGTSLAQFHQKVTNLPVNHQGWFNKKKARLDLGEFRGVLQTQIEELVIIGSEIFKQSLPKGIIHGDFNENNILVDERDKYRISAMFDFEETEFNILLIDFAWTLAVISRSKNGLSIDFSKVRSLIAGYTSVRPFTLSESKMLKQAVCYVEGVAVMWFVNNNYLSLAKEHVSRANYFRRKYSE